MRRRGAAGQTQASASFTVRPPLPQCSRWHASQHRGAGRAEAVVRTNTSLRRGISKVARILLAPADHERHASSPSGRRRGWGTRLRANVEAQLHPVRRTWPCSATSRALILIGSPPRRAGPGLHRPAALSLLDLRKSLRWAHAFAAERSYCEPGAGPQTARTTHLCRQRGGAMWMT